MEAVEFNGLLDDFARLDAQVIGASVDTVRANTKFAEKHGLTMPLLCDTERVVAAGFGVSRSMIGVARRTTFLIDPDGTVRKAYQKVTPRGHAAEVLAAARELWG